MANKKSKFPDGSITFDIECNEEARDFFKSIYAEHIEIEKAIKERIKQLFEEFVEVGGQGDKDFAYKQFLTLFGIGYQLGWNDYKNIIKSQEGN